MRLAPRFWVIALAALAIGLSGQEAKAAFKIVLTNEFSNDYPDEPQGMATIWLQDLGNDSVKVTFETAAGLPTNAKIFNLHLNFSSSTSFTPGSFSSIQKSGTFATPTFSAISSNAYKADGDGYFDILLTFSPDSGSEFNHGDMLSFIVSGTSASSLGSGMLTKSLGDGNSPDGLYAASQVGGLPLTNGEDSGWFTGIPVETSDTPPPIGDNPAVPAPAGLILLASAVPMLLLRRRFQKNLAA